MTPKKAARMIGISVSQIGRLIRAKKIKAKKTPLPFGGFMYDVPLKEARRYRDQPQTKGWPRGQSRPKRT